MKQLGSGTIWRVRIFDPETQSNEYFFLEDASKRKLEEDLDTKTFVTLGGNLIKSSFVSGIQRITHDDNFMHAVSELGENKKTFFSLIKASEMDEHKIKKALYDFILHIFFDRVLDGEVYVFRKKEDAKIGHRIQEFIKSMQYG